LGKLWLAPTRVPRLVANPRGIKVLAVAGSQK
jgi:hypothetical protein